ncbi:NUDIX hydrolase [Litoribacter ruber]|uniref:NUDIX domain-containing protein n=1 Tax=Litoribacter ruber TaxID=702568 RepID=UPI001BDAC0B0|nr:NUDIX hydrolase [Litoribacter ruber]MBT0811963.1 NUDIX hydrolase [Litoribacter ruber]
MKDNQAKIIKEETVFDNHFKIKKATLQITKPNGEWSEEMERMNFERGDSVAAVIYIQDKDEYLFTRQFRYPTYQTDNGWILELVAGSVEEGEEPIETLKREIMEEAGFETDEPVHLSTFFVSPGGTSERIHLYLCNTSSDRQKEQGGGAEEENEHIELVFLSKEDVKRRLAAQEFNDAKTLIGLLQTIK